MDFAAPKRVPLASWARQEAKKITGLATRLDEIRKLIALSRERACRKVPTAARKGLGPLKGLILALRASRGTDLRSARSENRKASQGTGLAIFAQTLFQGVYSAKISSQPRHRKGLFRLYLCPNFKNEGPISRQIKRVGNSGKRSTLRPKNFFRRREAIPLRQPFSVLHTEKVFP